MGAVYKATHLGTTRAVAIKIIHRQLSSNQEFVERFRREAEASGRLRHPNVVDVTDFGFRRTRSGPVAYLVMEYLDGCTLADVLEEERQLSSSWTVDILDQVCSAVDEAHRLGIIHRDLKPENIWLEPNRRGGYTVKVLDFGLAKLGDRAETAPATAGAIATDGVTLVHSSFESIGAGPRASAEGSGSLLRQAVSLYSEHFPAFLKISLLAHAPLMAFIVGLVLLDRPSESVSPAVRAVAGPLVFLAIVAANLFAYAAVSALTAPIVVLLAIAPLRQVGLGMALEMLMCRWWTFFATTVEVVALCFVVSLLL